MVGTLLCFISNASLILKQIKKQKHAELFLNEYMIEWLLFRMENGFRFISDYLLYCNQIAIFIIFKLWIYNNLLTITLKSERKFKSNYHFIQNPFNRWAHHAWTLYSKPILPKNLMNWNEERWPVFFLHREIMNHTRISFGSCNIRAKHLTINLVDTIIEIKEKEY